VIQKILLSEDQGRNFSQEFYRMAICGKWWRVLTTPTLEPEDASKNQRSAKA
jgi:hypothetical protein